MLAKQGCDPHGRAVPQRDEYDLRRVSAHPAHLTVVAILGVDTSPWSRA